MTRHLSNRWLPLAGGEAVALAFLLAPDARNRLPLYLLLFLIAAGISLWAARILAPSGRAFVLACAVVLRATLLLRAPDLSDDVWRYLWDGRIASEGISPYAFAPDDARVSGFAPGIHERLAHRDVATVYPPAAQAAFRVFGAGGSVLLWKTFVAAADVGVVALLAGSGGAGAGYAAALYAFHPLPVTEAAGQGHLDSVGVALLLACLAHLDRRRRVLAGASFALSALTKYVSLAAAIPLCGRGRCKFLAAAGVTAWLLWLAATRPGVSPLGGLGEYATRWDFNSPLYSAAVGLMDGIGAPARAKETFLGLKERWHHPEWTQKVFPFFYTAFLARLLLGLLLAGVLLAIGLRVRHLERAVFASIAVLLILAPTLYSWYLLWVLPFAAKRRDAAFLYLSFSIPISYALLYPLPGVPAGLILAAEFVPFAALLVVGFRRAAVSP